MADKSSSFLDYLPFVGAAADLLGSVSSIFENESNKAFAYSQMSRGMEYNTAERMATQAYNTDEREEVQNWNKQMWNENNAYNSPTNQMKLMQSAGINPSAAAMAITKGMPAASPVSSSPQSSTSQSATLLNPTTFNVGEMLSRIGMTMASSRLASAQAQGQENENRVFEENSELSKKERLAAIAASKSSTEYQDALRGKTQKEVEWLDKLNTLAIDEGYAKIEAAEAAIMEAQERVKLIEEEEQTERRKRQSMNAQDEASRAAANAANASAEASRAQAELTGEQVTTEYQKRANMRAEEGETNERTLKSREERKKEAWENSLRSKNINPAAPFGTTIVHAAMNSAYDNGKAISIVLSSAKHAIVDKAKAVGNRLLPRNKRK